MEFRDKGRDGGEVKLELCLQLNTALVETKKQAQYRSIKDTRSRMKRDMKGSPESPNCYLGKSAPELMDMRVEIWS